MALLKLSSVYSPPVKGGFEIEFGLSFSVKSGFVEIEFGLKPLSKVALLKLSSV